MKIIIAIVLIFSLGNLSAQSTSGEYVIKNLKINTENSDFGTSFFGDSSIVFSAPKNKRNLIKNVWKPNSQQYLDLFIGSINSSGEIVNKQNLLGTINSKFHEAQVAFTNDFKTVYFTGNNFEKNDSSGILRLQLFIATITTDGTWANIRKLPFNSDQYSTGHPALSTDNKKLYFVSDRPGSIGKTDIFIVDIKDDGTYSEPKNLGHRINTKGKEAFPFISSDGILFFSSNEHKGNGGLDVFASKITSTAFSKPQNLGITINSKKDDFAFIIDANNKKGYFSSNRKNGKGDDDIYGVKVVKPLVIECFQTITGIVKNKNTNLVIEQVVINIIDTDGNKLQEVVSNQEGLFNIEMSCNSSYKITAIKEGFENDEKKVITADDFDSRVINISLNLNPIIQELAEKKIDVNPIYFDLNSWSIRSDAARELDKVVDFMKKNPTVLVESRSHTDARGKDNSNLVLSDRRAKSTVAYIISQGIEASRISGKGLGETELLNKCSNFVKCNTSEHQLNRRTEFVIINKEQ